MGNDDQVNTEPVVPPTEVRTSKKTKNVIFVIAQPDVFKSPSSDTYVLFGEAKVDDFGQQSGLQKAAESMGTEDTNDDDIPALEEVENNNESTVEEVVTTGDSEFSEDDIALVMKQSEGVTREQAIDALKKTSGDVVNAIMELTQ